MIEKNGQPRVYLLIVVLLFGFPLEAFSATLPQSTQEILAKLKLQPSVLGDIDKELQVPKEWIEGAKGQGKLRITGSGFQPDLIRASQAPFKERYPFINIDYSSPGHEVRAIKTLVAYRTGRIITDIVSGLGGTIYQYKEANALEDLRPLPNWQQVVEGAKDPGGSWVGIETLHWCMAYNTKLVKKEELPKKWEDILATPRWRDGKLALANRPQLWALQLWHAKGESWTKDFLARLFADLKPQLRKEDMRALLQLAAAGEFQAVIPEAGTMTYKATLSGAPIGFTCPEPVPVAVEENVIIKGTPNIHAARLFLNWQLSREGQLAQYAALQYAPVHKDLQHAEFIPFGDQILGKRLSFREPGLELTIMPKLEEFWNGLWGGPRKIK